MKSGIYKIENKINGKIYIGQAVNLNQRKSTHFWELKINNHHNIKLQKSFNKYGIDNFTFEIIELCEKELLNERELFWINELNPQYNIRGGGNSIYGFTHSEETKKKMSEVQSKIDRSKNHFSLKSKKVICLNDGKEFESASKAAKYYNIKTIQHVHRVCRGERKSTNGYVFKFL